jgi:hypothetical protein
MVPENIGWDLAFQACCVVVDGHEVDASGALNVVCPEALALLLGISCVQSMECIENSVITMNWLSVHIPCK